MPATVVNLDAHREAPKPADLRPVVHETALGTGEPRSVHESEPVSAPTGDPVTPSAAKAQPHVAHGDSDVELYTPATIIEAARAVMGGIDLDPASCAQAQGTVQAARYFTVEDDGLGQEWSGKVWMNPLYAHCLVDRFVNKLLASSAVTQAVVLTNNATETQWEAALLQASAAVCFPTERVRFDRSDGPSTGAPLQGQMLVGMGSELDRNAFTKRFGALVSHLHSVPGRHDMTAQIAAYGRLAVDPAATVPSPPPYRPPRRVRAKNTRFEPRSRMRYTGTTTTSR